MVRPAALAALTAFVTLAFAFVSCQTYDFEPVTPLTLAQTTQKEARYARRLKPNVMLVVDKSGSMLEPIDNTDSRCRNANGVCGPSNPCAPECPTRMTDLRGAMSTFLGSSGTIARFGLIFFPADGSCGAPTGAPTVPLPAPTPSDDGTSATLQANADQINSQLSIAPGGGTPTGASINFAGGLPGLNDPADGREDVVLLLTDGLPNCNASNPNNSCAGMNPACNCTTSSCASNLCSLGCLDQDNTVAQIRALFDRKIRTLVIGFGADTAGTGAGVLQAMGEAGGFYPRCPNGTDAECGVGNRCDTSKSACERKFYQASNQADLQRVLKAFSDALITEPCDFLLDDKPSDPRFVAVIVDGKDVPPGPSTWTYTPATGTVSFADSSSYCAALKASTQAHPVDVEIRIIQQL